MEAFEYNGKTIVDMFLYSAVVYVLPVGKLRRHVPVEVFEGETRQEAINRVRKEVMGLPPETEDEIVERIKYENGA